MLEVILAVGLAQCCHSGVLLLLKGKLSFREKLIFSWMLLLSFHLGYSLLLRSGMSVGWHGLTTLNLSVPFVQPAFLFLYYVGRLSRKSWVHFLPALLFVGFHYWNIADSRLNDVFNLYLMTSIPVYSIYLLFKSRGNGFQMVNQKTGKSELFGKYLLYGLVFVWFSFYIAILFNGVNRSLPPMMVFGALTVFAYILGFVEIGKRYLLSNKEVQPRYSTSSLSEQSAVMLYQELLALIREKKPYLDPDLSLKQLAEETGIKQNQLSQIINSQSGLNFFDFINKFRIEEFVSRYQPLMNSNVGIQQVAFQCGFNSKSTFNRAFQKIYGLSPTRYFTVPEKMSHIIK